MKFRKLFSVLAELNLKTLYFNLKYLPINQAIRLPIYISRHVYLMNVKGRVRIEGQISTGQIKIGYRGVGIFDHRRSRAIWNVFGTIIFKGKAFIGHGSKISVGKSGAITFGNDFRMSAESSIASRKSIEFGENCLISWETLIMDTDYHKIYNDKKEQINQPQSIVIGDRVWIGCRCLILKGAKIPSGCVVAASSVMGAKELFGENKIFGGHPIRELKDNITWED